MGTYTCEQHEQCSAVFELWNEEHFVLFSVAYCALQPGYVIDICC